MNKGKPVIKMPGLAGIEAIKPSFFIKTRWIIPFLKYFALCLLILAIARPILDTGKITIISNGINIIIAVDVSESMAALDFMRGGKKIARLDAVKYVVSDFISGRNGDRISLVLFGTRAFTGIPLTTDYNAFSMLLKNIKIGMAGKKTAIGDAIGISLKRLENIKCKSNIIILLTDGQNNSGMLSPEDASKIASKRGVKIYTIGVGSNGNVSFKINDLFFGKQKIQQKVNIDEETLKNIASATGGKYYRAREIKELELIYEEINGLEKTEMKSKEFAEYRDIYGIFLIFALLFIFLHIILSNTRYLEIP